jgi:hypothetical protein
MAALDEAIAEINTSVSRLEIKFDSMSTLQQDCKDLLEGDNESPGIRIKVDRLEQAQASHGKIVGWFASLSIAGIATAAASLFRWS